MFKRAIKIKYDKIQLRRGKLLEKDNNRSKYNFKFKIQSKLIISFLLLSLTPTLIVGMFSYYKSSSAIKSKTTYYAKQILEKTADNIQGTIEDHWDCQEVSISKIILQHSQKLKWVTIF